MPMKPLFLAVILLLEPKSPIASPAPSGKAAPSGRAAPSGEAPIPAGDDLDQKRIHMEYNEGNFEAVIAAIGGFMSRNPSHSLEDSIFIAKHLAVVYSANPETREKGKYYMYRLLALVPSAKLIDMYVSDEIDRIFDRVREEFLARQKAFGVDSSLISTPGRPAPGPRIGEVEAPPRTASAQDRTRNSKPFYLAAGGAAIVAVGVTTYFLFSDSPKKTETIHVIP